VRFAVVGLGHFAQAAVLPAFAAAGGCELRAIVSDDKIKRRALARRYQAAAVLGYDDYDRYLQAGEVDAVYIALPNDLHADYAIRSARAGVHVLCEKPLAPDAAAAERIEAACREAGVKLMVAYRLHFEAANLQAVERVKRGDLGRPRFISTTFTMQVRGGNIRTQRARAGGPLLDLGVYCVNAARTLFGAEPTSALSVAATTQRDARFVEIDEQVSAILTFPDDRLAQLLVSFGAYDHAALTVVGAKGLLRLDPAYSYTTEIVMETQIAGRKPTHKVFEKRDQIAAELVAFSRSIRDDVQPSPSGAEGVADLRVIDAIERSIASGRAEPIDAVPHRQRPTRRPTKRQAMRTRPHGVGAARDSGAHRPRPTKSPRGSDAGLVTS
jgi:glucose-fructose oxidoreductase